jgi:hypothetical protein
VPVYSESEILELVARAFLTGDEDIDVFRVDTNASTSLSSLARRQVVRLELCSFCS